MKSIVTHPIQSLARTSQRFTLLREGAVVGTANVSRRARQLLRDNTREKLVTLRALASDPETLAILDEAVGVYDAYDMAGADNVSAERRKTQAEVELATTRRHKEVCRRARRRNVEITDVDDNYADEFDDFDDDFDFDDIADNE